MRGTTFFLLLLAVLSGGHSDAADIHVDEFVLIGGIRQWITIKGTDQNNPVLLFLHGGPGSSAMRYADSFTGDLQKYFVVVQWDQRATGKTEKVNRSPLPLTVAVFENDTFELINYLRNRFSKEKVYLMGHSWGGFLGMMMAAKHPELLASYFAVSPMIFQAESERKTLAIMLDRAQEEGNQAELEELSKISIPFQNGVQLYYHRKWLAHLMGQKSFSSAFVEQWAVKWLPLFNEGSAVDFFQAAPELKCPVYFFVGRKDYQTYFKLTEEYYQKVRATKKELFWFDHSAHAVITSEPQKLQEIIIAQLLHNGTN
jgi:pimeloyl-ACP methyl ester carboxylesterase